MKLVIAADNTPAVAFSLRQDEEEVEVYGNDTLLGWFEKNEDGKIQFASAFIPQVNFETFAVQQSGELATR